MAQKDSQSRKWLLTINNPSDNGLTHDILKEKLEFGTKESSPMAKFQLHLFGAIAEYEKSLIQSRVCEGLDAARARGVKLGRPKVYDEVMKQQVIFDYKSGLTYDDLMAKYHITRPTISKWCKEFHNERKEKLRVVTFD